RIQRDIAEHAELSQQFVACRINATAVHWFQNARGNLGRFGPPVPSQIALRLYTAVRGFAACLSVNALGRNSVRRSSRFLAFALAWNASADDNPSSSSQMIIRAVNHIGCILRLFFFGQGPLLFLYRLDQS